MRTTKIVSALAIFACVATAFAPGCGSTKSPSASTMDPSASSSGGDDSGALGASGSSCSPVGGGTCNPGQGLTCCVDLLAALSDPATLGTCVTESACASTVQYACANPAGCMTGQVCCGGIAIDAGGLFPGLPDAGDASFDAGAAFAAAGDSGGGGLPAALSGITLESFCQASCNTGQFVLCAKDSDCPANEVCGGLGAGTSSDASTSDLSGLLGGGGGLISLMTCVPADAGTGAGTPVPEAGTTTLGADASTADAGTPADGATTTTEAGAPPDAAE